MYKSKLIFIKMLEDVCRDVNQDREYNNCNPIIKACRKEMLPQGKSPKGCEAALPTTSQEVAIPVDDW